MLGCKNQAEGRERGKQEGRGGITTSLHGGGAKFGHPLFWAALAGLGWARGARPYNLLCKVTGSKHVIVKHGGSLMSTLKRKQLGFSFFYNPKLSITKKQKDIYKDMKRYKMMSGNKKQKN